MNVCIDNTDIIRQNRDRLSSIGTSGRIDNLLNQFESNIVSVDTTPIQNIISAYGKVNFENSIVDINRFLYTLNGLEETTQIRLSDGTLIAVSPINLDNYPALYDRIKEGTSITPIEVAEYMGDFLTSPFTVADSLLNNQLGLCNQLNAFYNDSFTQSSMGSFCALAPSIFGAVAGFFGAIGAIGALAGKINDLIGKIQNFNVAVLIDQLKNKIKEVVDKVIEKVKGVIENFSIENIMSNVETFVNENIIAKAKELKEKALSFFSEENLKKFKEKIDGLISYALNVFKDPDLEEIQFLVYRFCSLIGNVENLLNELKNPLDSFQSSFNEALTAISSNSGINSVRAIQSGALRFDNSVRRENTQRMQANTRARGTSNPAPVEVTDVEGVTSWNNGRGDSKIRFGPGLQLGKMGEEGWTRVDTRARVYLMRVQERFGRQLQVNSGYRSPAYNASIGGASRSKHMSGQAIDVSWNGMTTQNREEFINIAYEEGFLGIGRYGTRFVHVDLGPRRTWGS